MRWRRAVGRKQRSEAWLMQLNETEGDAVAESEIRASRYAIGAAQVGSQGKNQKKG